MKKLGYLGLLFIFVVAIMSCVSEQPSTTSNNTNNALAQFSKVSLVQPDMLVGKTLEGTGGASTKYNVTYVFRADGTMTRTQDGIAAEGTWKYDAKQQMRKYTLNWAVGDAKYGYIVDIFVEEGTYTIHGDWTITDAYITISETLVEAK